MTLVEVYILDLQMLVELKKGIFDIKDVERVMDRRFQVQIQRQIIFLVVDECCSKNFYE